MARFIYTLFLLLGITVPSFAQTSTSKMEMVLSYRDDSEGQIVIWANTSHPIHTRQWFAYRFNFVLGCSDCEITRLNDEIKKEISAAIKTQPTHKMLWQHGEGIVLSGDFKKTHLLALLNRT